MTTTPSSERRYGVWLYNDRVGTLNQRGDYTWFTFVDDYLDNPRRAVLGLIFEEQPTLRHASALRLPPWFSNLLPEGLLRDWIAAERHVSVDREMELLVQVGHDLPGAVRVLPEDEPPESWEPGSAVTDPYTGRSTVGGVTKPWRFSLAGVGLKFSMVKQDDRLTLPAYGEGGDWIVKLPDPLYQHVPRNEYAMMTLAAQSGIDVPARMLIHRDQLDGLPDNVWPGTEEWAYAVRRFDRDDHRGLVHIEDLAQVRNCYPNDKYRGNVETLASLIYRGRDTGALQEFARRAAFNVMITNGDAHLKNWSLIYRDSRVPTLSPAYDLVSTGIYDVRGQQEDMGLRFGNTRDFRKVSLDTFASVERRLAVSPGTLVDQAAATVERVGTAWPEVAVGLEAIPDLRNAIELSINERTITLLRNLA